MELVHHLGNDAWGILLQLKEAVLVGTHHIHHIHHTNPCNYLHLCLQCKLFIKLKCERK